MMTTHSKRKLLVRLALLLALFVGLPAAAPVATARGAPQVAAIQRQAVEASELYRVSAPATLGGNAIKVDGAGNLFASTVHYSGNDTEIWTDRYARDGTLTGSWSVLAPAVPTGYDKEDSVSLAASGADLFIGLVSHLTSNRDYPFSVGRIQGVYVPYATGAPEDGPGAYLPAASAGLTDADIQRIADAVYARVLPQFDRTIGNIQPKVAGLFAGSNGNFDVYQQLLNTSYSGALSAMRDYRTPTPTPHP